MLTGHLRSSSSCQIPWHYRTARCRQEPSAPRRPVNPAAHRLAQDEVHTPIHHQLVRTGSSVTRQAKRASTTPDALPEPCAASSFRAPFSLFWVPFPLFPRSPAPFPGQLLIPRACSPKAAKPARSQSLMISTLPLKPRPNPPQPAPVRCTWSQPTCGILSPTCGCTSRCPRSTPNPFQSPVEICLGPPNPPAKPASCLRTKDPLPWSFFAIKTPICGLKDCSIKQQKGGNHIIPVQSRAYCAYSK